VEKSGIEVFWPLDKVAKNFNVQDRREGKNGFARRCRVALRTSH
jgi:hypothetical protein